MTAPAATNTDVIIAGGGPIGMLAALALGRHGLRCAIVDTADPAARHGTPVDGRTTALSHASIQLLRGIDIWPSIEKNASPILDIRVSDGDSLLFVHYDHSEIGDEPLGYIVENQLLWDRLFDAVDAMANVTYIAPAGFDSVERTLHGVTAVFADGSVVKAPLILACEGRQSPLRRDANIGVSQWDYKQTAIVLTVAHAGPHGDIAHERFLPAGPFAILPMTDDADGRHRSSVVWTERTALVPSLLELSDDLFLAELEHRFGDFLGALEVVGRRWSYPLSFINASRYVDTRLALVGDAGHAMHPIAGQGLNMGVRDIAALCQSLVEARRLGADIGAPAALNRYERWRRFDNTALMYITDGLNRLFSNSIPPVRAARDLGFGFVNRTPPLRRAFMRHAMGQSGDLPKLLTGEKV